ncbi:hypothetical protein V475_17300 [Sphingobium baderi LL03]|uniref:Uncharacterized protein n=1 Tax=Sphingobium baderi LL03 TaxID=1114964 RepID=T0G020_9SPHN|nr:hypothetical protein L485_23250 [Sphingobium baderi LL03]KMS64278.1 hypothetical protein V475_17300 [Sphingobium baderi LL03]
MPGLFACGVLEDDPMRLNRIMLYIVFVFRIFRVVG